MIRRKFPIGLVLLMTLILTGILQPVSSLETVAQQGRECRTFRETGKMVCGAFLNYWLINGGVTIFGYPVSNEFNETSKLDGKEYLTQYFERVALEWHPENKAPYDVLLAHLGASQFKGQYSGREPGVPNIDTLYNLPIYSAAYDVKVERMRVGNLKNKTTFVTKDSGQLVLGFYKDIMAKNPQWRLYIDMTDALEFSTPPEAEYTLVVVIRATVLGQTFVELLAYYNPPG